MVITMNKEEYKKLVNKHIPKKKKLKSLVIAFLVGGLIGFLAQISVNILISSFGLIKTEAYAWTCLIMILVSSFLTALGFFDNWVSKVKAGLIIPTTGFAHSITSCALDYKKDGLITGLGSNFFKLAGSVILYGIISSFFLCLLEVIIHG